MTAIAEDRSSLRIFNSDVFNMAEALCASFPGRHRACRVAQAADISLRAAQMLLAGETEPSGRTFLALMRANSVFHAAVVAYTGGWCDTEMKRLEARIAITQKRRAARRGTA